MVSGGPARLRQKRRREHPVKEARGNQQTYRAAHAKSPYTRVDSRVPLLSCCTKLGLWKATQAGYVLEMTRSHSAMSSGVSLGGKEFVN